MRILAVDDDPIILELLKEILSSSGQWQISVAESGDEALALLRERGEEFDCFLLDIQMPGMDGVELCRRIRGLPQYGRSPILMLTAMSEKSYIDRSFAAGASDYITKPFDPVEVEARIRTAGQIVEERRRAAESNLALMSMRRDNESKHRQLLADPITIPDVDGMIEPLALENYLLQLGRVEQYMSAIIAVKVTNITEIFQECTERNFRYFLEDMADALSDSLRRWRHLMSYVGSGVFVIAVDRRDADALREGLKTDLPMVLNESAPVFDSGARITIDIAVGEACCSSLLKSRTVQESMQIAIASAETKAPRRRRPGKVKSAGVAWSGHTAARPDPVMVAW